MSCPGAALPGDGTGPARIVVTGAGVLCSTALDVDGLSQALRAGRSGIGVRGIGVRGIGVRGIGVRGANLPAGPARTPGGAGPDLSADLVGFDFAGIVGALDGLPLELRRGALRAASRAPLAVRAAVTVALQAWESAGLHRAPAPGGRIGIVVGGHNLGGAYADTVRPRYDAGHAFLPARYALQFMDTDHVGMVSQILGITGEGYTVGGASASGNVAIINGSRLVTSGAVDVCLVLGALTDLSAMQRQAFFNSGAMAGARGTSAPRARARPFDERREGFVPAQGAACLVLESAGPALKRGVRPWAAVPGHALCLDANSLADPDAAGEAWVMSEALRRAGLEPEQVDYVNTHGTGSRLGDETEVAALREVFGGAPGRPLVNSTKGLVGHCGCAAGVVEAVATLVQLRDRFVHPNANLDSPIDTRLRFVGARAEPADLTVALSNAFGFGGFNTSVVFTRWDEN